jgi:hypothetical protein
MSCGGVDIGGDYVGFYFVDLDALGAIGVRDGVEHLKELEGAVSFSL